VTVSVQGKFDQALAAHQAGHLGRAETLYREILAEVPHHADSLHLLGLLAQQAGQQAAALELMGQAVSIQPNVAAYLSNYGEILRSAGRLPEAIQVLERARILDPASANTHHNLGVAQAENKDTEEALRSFHRAIQLNPTWPDPRKYVVQILTNTRRVSESAEPARAITKLLPDDAEAFQVLGGILNELLLLEEAAKALERAVELNPKSGHSWNELGAVYTKQQRTEDAADAYRQAMVADPMFDWPYNNYAGVLKDIGRIDEAIVYFRQGLQLNPTMHAARSNMLLSMHYSNKITADELFAEHLAWEPAFRHDAMIVKPSFALARDVSPDRPLRIGYISADFRAHSVADFLESVLKHHDRRLSTGGFQIYAYSDVILEDSVTDRMRPYFDGWRNILRQPHEHVAQQIYADQIDILIDLAGHSACNRMPVFAMKPAPIQVSWLGYPNTTGLSTIDYRLTDEWADPSGLTEHLHTEKLWRLPQSFLCFQSTVGSPEVNALPCDTHPYITLGCFNNFAKLNLPLIKLWAQILNALPNARLLLKATVLGKDYAQKAMRDYFEQANLDISRVQLLGSEIDFFKHLGTYHQVDLALDTFPYHGTTTTCEALWMGVPVISLAGSIHASRVGISLLHQVGLEALIAESPDEYIEKTVALANNRSELRQLRAQLRTRLQSSALMDSVSFTRNFEAALRSMWLRKIGQSPVEASPAS
jgi:protein O-GlcNAc transferase